MSKRRQKVLFGTFWVVLVASFIFFATLLILVANGYHLDSKNFKLEKTGMIILNGAPDGVNISINGTDKGANFPYRLSGLIPGRYVVTVSDLNYQNWNKVYEVSGGQAILDNVYLFFDASKVIIQEQDPQTINKITSNYKSQSASLKISGEEIYKQDEFLTRFSQPVLAAIQDLRTQTIIFQIGNTINVISQDGTNYFTLINLKNATATEFYVSGNTLYYIDGNKAYSAQIR